MAFNIPQIPHLGYRQGTPVPWHGQGNCFPADMSNMEALVSPDACNLGFTVSSREAFTQNPNTGDYSAIPGYQLIVRDDNNTVLHIPTQRYGILQYKDAFELPEELDDILSLETGGYFGAGEVAWAQYRIKPETFSVGKDDPIYPYLTLFSSHNGKYNSTFRLSFTRVVCSNTFSHAYTSKHEAADLVNIKHTRNGVQKLEEFREALTKAVSRVTGFNEFTNKLLKTRMGAGTEWDDFLDFVMPTKTTATGDLSSRTENNRMLLTELFDDGTGIVSENRGTAWAAYCAVTEYVTHYRGTKVSSNVADSDRDFVSAANRFQSSLLDAGADMIGKAHAYLLDMAS